ncbi:MAG: hypothetical protein N2235_24510 [Fischerella sp.]|nr:hypothetical protein [Fischerella sp.]
MREPSTTASRLRIKRSPSLRPMTTTPILVEKLDTYTPCEQGILLSLSLFSGITPDVQGKDIYIVRITLDFLS